MVGDGDTTRSPRPGPANAPGLPHPRGPAARRQAQPGPRRAYRADLCDFFGGEPTQSAVREFLSLAPPQVALRLATYKARMLERGLAEATINRRLAALRSCSSCRTAWASPSRTGAAWWTAKGPAYRDTRGVDVQTLRRLISSCRTRRPCGAAG